MHWYLKCKIIIHIATSIYQICFTFFHFLKLKTATITNKGLPPQGAVAAGEKGLGLTRILMAKIRPPIPLSKKNRILQKTSWPGRSTRAASLSGHGATQPCRSSACLFLQFFLSRHQRGWPPGTFYQYHFPGWAKLDPDFCFY